MLRHRWHCTAELMNIIHSVQSKLARKIYWLRLRLLNFTKPVIKGQVNENTVAINCIYGKGESFPKYWLTHLHALSLQFSYICPRVIPTTTSCTRKGFNHSAKTRVERRNARV